MNLPPSGGALEATLRDFVPGQKLFNRYSLKRVLGRGGMGVVWLARDDVLDREVALKFLPEVVFYDRGMLDDLKRETNRSLELTHKNIVRIYDFVHNESSGCISMEYVDGDTLSNIRADRPLRLFECLELGDWTKQLCEALEYAHNHARVVHRDLKPANLMMNLRGDLKVTDFGIARSLSDSVSMLTVGKKHTSGTLVYMSPQQLDGARGSHLDDIYSLGATLYELLTSKPPFFSGNIDRQIHERKPPPMGFRREELDIVGGEPIDPIWEDVVAACLAKDPAERPQSALDVITRLTAPAPRTTSILAGWLQSTKTVTKTEKKPPTAQPVPTATRPKREPRPIFRPAWLAVCAAFVAVGGGLRNTGVTASRGISAVFIGAGHGMASFGRLVGNDVAALLKAIAGGFVVLARGAVFVIVTPAKLIFGGVATAVPILFRASRNAGAALIRGSAIAGKSVISATRVLSRETVLGSAITIVPATIAASLIWFFAIRTPPPPQVVEQKPVQQQPAQTQTNVALIEPVAAKPMPPVPPPALNVTESKPPPPPQGGLSIDTTPSGAKVIVDASIIKTTPASISDLPVGKHHLQIVMPDYVTEERDVDVKDGEVASQGTVALRRIPPPVGSPATVTAEEVTKPVAKSPEQEPAVVVKKGVHKAPKSAATPERQVVAAPQRPPPSKTISQPAASPKPSPERKRLQNPFGEGVPGG